MIELNFRPNPVSVTVPTMSPALAQVTAMPNTLVEPLAIAWVKRDEYSFLRISLGDLNKSQGRIAVSERIILVTADKTVAQNTDRTGEKPSNIKTTIDMSEKKWYQYFFTNSQVFSIASMWVSFIEYLRTSISTITNNPR